MTAPKDVAEIVAKLTDGSVAVGTDGEWISIRRYVRDETVAKITDLSGRLAEAERERNEARATVVEKQRARIGDSEFAGAHLCRAERAEARALSAEAEVGRLRAALEPFAAICDAEHGGPSDRIWTTDENHWLAHDHQWGRRVTVAMMRAARAALTQPPAAPSQPDAIRLAVEAEREACAKIAASFEGKDWETWDHMTIARAIRSRARSSVLQPGGKP